MKRFSNNGDAEPVYAYVLGWYDTKRKELQSSFPTVNWNYESIKSYDRVTVLLVQSLPQTREETQMLTKYVSEAGLYNVRFILPPPISAYPAAVRVCLSN